MEVRYADERLAALWENCKAAKVRGGRKVGTAARDSPLGAL